MKRLAVLPLLTVVLVAVGCGTPPPQSWKPPTIQSVVLSTSEIVAGSNFTVTVAATDDHSVANVGFRFYDEPNGDAMAVPCQVADWEPGPVVTVEAACAMPAIAANGAWQLRVEAIDAEFSGGGEGACGCGASNSEFTVTGGTEDRQPPIVDSMLISPQPLTVGTPFTATFQVSDEHPGDWDPPLWIGYYPNGGADAVTCVETSHTTLTANQHEWSFNCGVASAGHAVLIGQIADAMGHYSLIYQEFDVAA